MKSTIEDWITRAKQGLKEIDVDYVRDTGILPERGEKFFPVIGYPPLTMFREMDETALFANFASRPVNPIAVYVHVPFCPTRCTFCHWITKTKSKEDEVDVYIDYLDREMALYKSKMGYDKIPTRSVLFGGGTPTYPNPKQMRRMLESFTRHFDLSECTQFSMEAEPATLIGPEGEERLRIMKEFGVQRVSLGVQSFDDDVLAYMGRSHNHAETLQSIENIKRFGIDNVFIDLIYGYPGQTVENWIANMLQAVRLNIEGYQLYRLRIKQHGDRPGNIIKQFNKAPEKFHRADEVFLMKYLGKAISEEFGFPEQERRVFAKSKELVSHYLYDWTAKLYDVVGIGVSSWSNLRGVFSQNIGDQSLEKYYHLIDQGKVSVDRGKVRTADDEARRSFLIPLKNYEVDKAAYLLRTGGNATDYFAAEIEWLKSFGMIEETSSTIRLTQRGAFFADEVATQFFDPNYLPFPDVARPPKRKAG